MNLAHLGEESLRRYGEYPALVFEGRELTNLDQPKSPIGRVLKKEFRALASACRDGAA